MKVKKEKTKEKRQEKRKENKRKNLPDFNSLHPYCWAREVSGSLIHIYLKKSVKINN